MDIGSVNYLPYEDFVDVFGNVVEKCPLITAAVWSRRPFSSLADLEASINDFIDALSESGIAKDEWITYMSFFVLSLKCNMIFLIFTFSW